MKFEYGKVSNLDGIARIFLKTSRLKKANSFALKSFSIARKINIKQQIKLTSELLYLISKRNNNSTKALYYLELSKKYQ
mgnify:CR=1 FL=1